MRHKSLLLATLLLSASAFAKDPKAYLDGKVLQMDSVKCGDVENGAANSKHKKTQEVLCQEYVIQGEKTLYHVRPTDTKHQSLLPVGEAAQFRMEKTKMHLRVEATDGKEREYVVVSMSPRTDASAADAAPAKVNHLQ